jgi:two-component system phosphate regulon sensor histidine kinase PhoR
VQKRLILSYITIIFIAIAISTAIFWNKGYVFIYNHSQDYYLSEAELLGDLFSEAELTNNADYNEFVDTYSEKYNVRITLIDSNGEVLADSSTSQALENHGTREEVIRAFQGESVTVNRYSSTMKQEYSYSAVPVENENFQGVLRISLPLSDLEGLQIDLIGSTFVAAIICFVIATAVALIFSGVITRPINDVAKAAERISEGNYNTKIYTREKAEIGRLASAFNIMSLNMKETIESLTHRNAELEAILSSMTGGVVAIDDSNEILFYNKAFHDIMGINKEINGLPLYNIVRNAAVFDIIDKVRESNTSVTKDGILLYGGNRNIRITATPLGREGETWFGVLLIIEDITQIKKLEKMRTDFVSNVTHELKTPLTSIRGFIDTLKNGAIKEEAVARRFLDIIDIEAERLFNLIQDILLLSEIESKQEKNTIPCDINKLATDVIELLQPKLTDKVKIVFQPEENLEPFNCNQDRIKQLFINIIDNAIKYTEEGTITLECKEQDKTLMIKVKDTGIGMEPEHLSRIFERFYRVDKGRARKQGGTGLGLSIVKHIVELYNGTIWVNSKLGVGTEFEIKIPY